VLCALAPRPAWSAAGAIRLALSEESLATAAQSPRATPSTSASPGSPAPSAIETPLPSASPGSAASSEPSSAETGGESQTGAAAAEVPPAADLSGVALSAPVSASSLEPLIQQTTDPSLGASLRIAEEARQQIGENHYDEAIRSLGRALSIDASNPYAYFYLGRAWLMKKDYRQALTFFSRAELGLGSNPPWLGETVGFEGACYEELQRDQDAALAYKRAVQLAPGNLMARAGYGRLAAALPPPPLPPEEEPTAENATQAPPDENDVRTVPEGEPLETAPPREPAPPAAAAPDANEAPSE
jgi:tetratricopeptide (TPR) repeat protein